MPIYPRYESSTHVASPETPLRDTTPNRELEQVGAALQNAGMATHAVGKKIKELNDHTLVAERWMQAVEEMEAEQEKYKGENADDAKKKFNEFVTKRQGEWYKGLDGEARYMLDQRLGGRTLEYKSAASKIENRFKIDRYGAAMFNQEKNIQTRVNRGQILGDPADSPEVRQFNADIDAGVRTGLIPTKEEGEKQK